MIPVAHIAPLLRQLAANIAGGAAWNREQRVVSRAMSPRVPVPSMKKSILFLGLAFAAALVVALAWSLRGAQSSELTHGDAAQDETFARTELDPAAEVEVEAAAPARRDVLDTSAPVTDGPTIFVVERDSGRALAGADVIWESGLDPRAELESKITKFIDTQGRERGETTEPRRTLTLLSGRRFTTDASGRVRVPSVAKRAVVVAHHGVLTGSVEVPSDERGVVRVELADTDDLVVRVVTATGEPASGINVSVDLGFLGTTVGGSAMTDVSGRARFVQFRKNLASSDPLPQLYLSLDLPFVDKSAHALSTSDLEARFVELTLPPTGTVTVRVRMADGTVPRRGSLAALAPEGDARVVADDVQPAPSRNSSTPAGFLNTFHATPENSRGLNKFDRLLGGGVPIVDGLARFEHVGLGRRWTVRSGGSGLEAEHSREFAGPTQPGETVTVELDFKAQPIVRWKLLDANGAPYAKRQIAGQLSKLGGTDDGKLVSDAEGRVQLALSTEADDIVRRTLKLTFDDREKVELDLSREFPPGVTVLPDIELREKTRLAAGRVVDANGTPVEGAVVRVERQAVVRSDQETDASTSAELWTTLRELTAVSRADGSFTVWGETPDASLGLRASTRNGLVAAERVLFTPGQDGLELRVVAPGGIRARVRGPAELELDQLTARIALAGTSAATSDASSRQRVVVSADGALLAGGLMPGRWELVIGASPTSELARIDGIVVTSGETIDAGVIDLGARLARVRLVVSDETGKRLGNATARCLTPSLRSKRPVQTEVGVFEYLVPAEGCDVNVECEGHRGVTLTRVRGDQHVVLQSGVNVRVRALGNARLATDELKLGVQFEFDGPDAQGASARGRMFGGTFDTAREFAAIAPFDGPYRAWWTVETQRGTGWAVRAVSLPSTERFVIERGKNGTVIELVVPPGLLDDAALSVKERDESGKTNTAPVKIEPPRRG